MYIYILFIPIAHNIIHLYVFDSFMECLRFYYLHWSRSEDIFIFWVVRNIPKKTTTSTGSKGDFNFCF